MKRRQDVATKAALFSLALALLVSKTNGFLSTTGKNKRTASVPRPLYERMTMKCEARYNTRCSSAASSALDLDDMYNPNMLHPRTVSLTRSIRVFGTFVVQRLVEIRRNKRKQKETPSWVESMRQLNQRRAQVVTLADYTRKIVAPSFFFLGLGAVMTSVVPHYYAQCLTLVATATTSGARDAAMSTGVVNVARALLGLVVTSTLAAFLTGGRGSLFWVAGARANYNIRVKLHRHLLLQEAAFFDDTEVGSLLSRIQSDVTKIGNVISFHVNIVTRQLCQFVIGAAYLVALSPRLALAALGGIGVIAYISAVYGAWNRDLSQRVQDAQAEATAVAETSLTLSETVRAFNGVSAESERFQKVQGEALQWEEVQAWAYGVHKFISDSLQAFLQGALLWACWQLGRSGSGLSAAQLTSFVFYSNFVLESSNEVGDQWAKIQGAVGASSSVFDLIRRIPRIRDQLAATTGEEASSKSKSPELTHAAGVTQAADGPQKMHRSGEDGADEPKIEVVLRTDKNALVVKHAMMDAGSHHMPSFPSKPVIEMSGNMTIRYEAMAADGPAAIDGINLQIMEGDRVAIVGRSGSGKSSLLRAILRFYDPVEGTVSLNGVPLTTLSREELTSQIAVVPQEPALFPMTVLENVLYGIEPDIDEGMERLDGDDKDSGSLSYSTAWRRRATEALIRAGLPIHPGNDLNLSLDTRVGEGGRSLSGGQRQRVALARALVRQPAVLLLDEPTSALDSKSSHIVVQALRRASLSSQCMVMVTHRLGIIRSLDVNRVLVMERGQVVESGHPEALLQQPESLYAALAREQGITALQQPEQEHVRPTT